MFRASHPARGTDRESSGTWVSCGGRGLASAREGREQGERRIEPNLVSTWPRVTNGAGGVRQSRVVLTVVATVKSCGRRHEGQPALAVNFSQGDGGQRNSAPGARHKPSNHSRREGRDVSAALYVAVQPPFALHTHSEPRVPAGARPSLRPRHSRGAKPAAKLGPKWPRGREIMPFASGKATLFSPRML